MDVGAEVVEVRVERSLAIVVIHLSAGDPGVLDREIEDARATAGVLAGRRSGKVVLAVRGDLDVHDRMIDNNLAQRDLAAQSRNNSQLDREFVGMKQGWLVTCFGAAQGDVVEVSGESSKVEIEAPNLNVSAGGEVCLFDDLADRKLLEACRRR